MYRHLKHLNIKDYAIIYRWDCYYPLFTYHKITTECILLMHKITIKCVITDTLQNILFVAPVHDLIKITIKCVTTDTLQNILFIVSVDGLTRMINQ